MKSKNLKAAQLSKMAGLNPRAVKDIEEERIKNPRIQTVLALEAAMELPFGKLLGKSIDEVDGELLSLLGELDAATQKQLLMTLQSLSSTKTHSL
ncbi:helix-turn-helix domain-containing protein [Lentibacter sp.]|jgi:transcriptional regulator with XRE-family HTH domain|uniref:helix-turn-helix domain-containing protein n=1 Tax=Lentibacter sp. TaxID=2024994 RepID=UPI003F69E1EB